MKNDKYTITDMKNDKYTITAMKITNIQLLP